MNIKTIKLLRNISKIVLVLVGVGLLGYLGYLGYISYKFPPYKVTVSNITDSSFTVSWVTDTPTKGYVYYKEKDSFLPGPLGWINSGIAYDDRDWAYNQSVCVHEFNANSEVDDTFTVVNSENFDCDDIEVKDVADFYTHHITLKNLDAEKEYYFRVGNGFWVWEDEESSSKTFATLMDVKQPYPMFGKVVFSDDIAFNDTVIYGKFVSNLRESESIIYSSVTNEEGGWYIDGGNVRDSNGNVLDLVPGEDLFRVTGQFLASSLSYLRDWVFMDSTISYEDIVISEDLGINTEEDVKGIEDERGEVLGDDDELPWWKKAVRSVTRNVIDFALGAAESKVKTTFFPNLYPTPSKKETPVVVNSVVEDSARNNPPAISITANPFQFLSSPSDRGEGDTPPPMSVYNPSPSGNGRSVVQSPEPKKSFEDELNGLAATYLNEEKELREGINRTDICLGGTRCPTYISEQDIADVINGVEGLGDRLGIINYVRVVSALGLDIDMEVLAKAGSQYANENTLYSVSALSIQNALKDQALTEDQRKALEDQLKNMKKPKDMKEEGGGDFYLRRNSDGTYTVPLSRSREQSVFNIEIAKEVNYIGGVPSYSYKVVDNSGLESLIGSEGLANAYENCVPDGSSKCVVDIRTIPVELDADKLIDFYDKRISECEKDLACDVGSVRESVSTVVNSFISSYSEVTEEYQNYSYSEAVLACGRQQNTSREACLKNFIDENSLESELELVDCGDGNCTLIIKGSSTDQSDIIEQIKEEAKSVERDKKWYQNIIRTIAEDDSISIVNIPDDASGKYEIRGGDLNGRRVEDYTEALSAVLTEYNCDESCVNQLTADYDMEINISSGKIPLSEDLNAIQEKTNPEGVPPQATVDIESLDRSIEQLKNFQDTLSPSALDYDKKNLVKRLSSLSKIFSIKKAIAQEPPEDSFFFFIPEYGAYTLELGPYTFEKEVTNGEQIYVFYLEVNGQEGLQLPPEGDTNYGVGYDVVLEGLASEIKYTKTASAKTYDLKEGINIVSFDFVPSYNKNNIYYAKDLVEQTANRNIEFIARYDAGRWAEGISCKGTDGCFGTDFPLTPGRGYVIRVSEDTKITIPGYEILDPVPVNYSTGWNLVGVHGYSQAYTAGSLIESINKVDGLTADNVSWWPTSKGRYEGLQVTDGTTYGLDFPISPKNGYFVRISKFNPPSSECRSIIWHPGGNLNGVCGDSKSLF